MYHFSCRFYYFLIYVAISIRYKNHKTSLRFSHQKNGSLSIFIKYFLSTKCRYVSPFADSNIDSKTSNWAKYFVRKICWRVQRNMVRSKYISLWIWKTRCSFCGNSRFFLCIILQSKKHSLMHWRPRRTGRRTTIAKIFVYFDQDLFNMLVKCCLLWTSTAYSSSSPMIINQYACITLLFDHNFYIWLNLINATDHWQKITS